MGILNDILKTLGVGGTRKSGVSPGAGLPTLPNPNEVKEGVETIVEAITNLKSLPKTLIDRITEVDQDFKEADKALRSTRIRGKKK